MRKFINTILLVITLLTGFIYAQDVNLVLDGQNLDYVSTADIAGWNLIMMVVQHHHQEEILQLMVLQSAVLHQLA